jgi:hypothetical protein
MHQRKRRRRRRRTSVQPFLQYAFPSRVFTVKGAKGMVCSNVVRCSFIVRSTFARGGMADGRSAGIHIVFFIAFLDIGVRRDCSRVCSFRHILLIRNRLLFLQKFHVICSCLLTPADA